MRVVTVVQNQKVLGYIAIDSTVAGSASGGLRMALEVDPQELELTARAMTLKCGLLGLPQGGASACVIGDPDAPFHERRERMERWATAARQHLRSREYVPQPDMGTGNELVRHALSTAGVPVKRRELRGIRAGYYTGLSVFLALEVLVARLGQRLEDKTAIIEGFGSVGKTVAALLFEAGVRLVGASTSRGAVYGGPFTPAELQQLLETPTMTPPELLERSADMLVPCGRHHSIQEGNARRVQAAVVCSGADCPVTEEAEAMLVTRGVACFPDFAANCGGVLGSTMEAAGVAPGTIQAFLRSQLRGYFDRLLVDAGSPAKLRRHATDVALRRFAAVRTAAEDPTAGARLRDAALDVLRRGWVPEALAGPLALRYFERKING